jgi:2-polyprenyl-3-methyl-5-hydroxy-6-metoxy-1,4-benzoquinol methylase
MVIVQQKQETYTIYANCQTSLIQAHLNLSEEFRQKYRYEELPRNYVAIQQELNIPEDVISRTKLLIYQPVDDKYGTRSSDYIINKVPSDCICISFPYVYFEGYWPENTDNPVNQKNEQYPFGKFPYGDSNIIEMIAKGYEKAQIVAELEKDDFYQIKYVELNIQQTLDKLLARETETDIKIAKFIQENYRHSSLFHAPNHPANIIGFNLANQILDKLNIPPISSPYPREKFADYQLPIYPSIKKLLDLQFIDQETKYTVTFSPKKLKFPDYIQAYLKQYGHNEDISETNETNEINNFHQQFDELKQKTLGKLSTQLFAIDRKAAQQSRLFTIDLIPHIHRLFYNVEQGTVINVLDVGIHSGAGTGLLADIHNRRSYNHLKMNVTGLDIVDNFGDYFKFVKQDIFKIPDHQTWDLVICSHVIEHLPDPIPFIQKLRKLTSKYLIIACPYNETELREGHAITIDSNLISQLNPLEYHVYTNFCWRVRGECLIMIFDALQE